jgi:hypothetical protein
MSDVLVTSSLSALQKAEAEVGIAANPPIPFFRNKFQIGDRQLAGLGRDTPPRPPEMI